MALEDVDVPQSPAWWMVQLSRRMLDRNRLTRFAVLDAYRSGCPPLLNVSDSQRKAFYAFNRIARSNFARPIVRAAAERMAFRSIRTAAANDDNGDKVAWRLITDCGLDVASVDVHSDMLTFSEAYARVCVSPTGQALAFRCDPWYTITAQDPLNPDRTVAALMLAYDQVTATDYAYLWLPGQQWVASRPRKVRPPMMRAPGTMLDGRSWARGGQFPKLSFSPATFTMRPDVDDVAEEDRDGGPYSETYDEQDLPVVMFENRDGIGEFEEHLDLLDRINHTILQRVLTAAVQAFKQRALKQPSNTKDALPARNPETGEPINWDEIFMPGLDALWKLPPGVEIWESGEIQLGPILSAANDDIKHLSVVTGTPFSIFSPDGANQSAEGASGNKEMIVFKVEDRDRIAGRKWSRVISLMFKFGPVEDRYVGEGDQRVDRADPGLIIIDWMPAERYSLQEMSQADSLNKSLSPDMAAAKFYGLTPDEVAINRAQRASEVLLAPAAAPGVTGGPGSA